MTSLYPKACGQHVVEGRKVWTSYAKFEQRVTFFFSFFFLFREKRRAASDVLQDTMPLRVPRDTARLRPANAGRVCQLNIDDVAVFLTQPGAARYGGWGGGAEALSQQRSLIGDLYARFLSVPLGDLDDAREELNQWVEEYKITVDSAGW